MIVKILWVACVSRRHSLWTLFFAQKFIGKQSQSAPPSSILTINHQRGVNMLVLTHKKYPHGETA
jgi:hypothetical protein